MSNLPSVASAVEEFLVRQVATRRRTFPLAGLEAWVKSALGAAGYLEAGEYRALGAAVADAVARGAVVPVKARGTNGRKPPLFKAYRIPARERPVQEVPAASLHPRIDRAGARRLGRAHSSRVEALSHYLYAHPRPGGRLPVPRNERSLELFGDEKFLEAHRSFLPSLGLTLEDLHAFETREPFFHRAADGSPAWALIVENLSAYESAARALAARRDWPWGERPGLLVYGEGKKILRSVEYLGEFPGIEACEYFGDLDPTGVEILADLRDREPRVRPGEALYRGLLAREALARPLATPPSEASREGVGRAFGEESGLAEPVRALFRRRLWLPQEALGLEALLAGP